MTLTVHKSQFTVQAECSREIAAHLICSFAVNAGCETRERIVLLLAFVASQYPGNIFKCSLQVMAVAVLPHITVEHRHLGM